MDDLLEQGRHVMTVCNACRYCEAYCPVFPAIENRVAFSKGDLAYLANLCHNCGECLYACQYAPPHEFGINVPRTLSQIRVGSYEEYCWPRFMRVAFTRQPLLTAIGAPVGFIAVLLMTTRLDRVEGADFYQVVSHDAMVALFGAVSVFVLIALALGCAGLWRDAGRGEETRLPSGSTLRRGFRDALSLRHLQTGGVDCTDAVDHRAPWRRWLHHATFYGFALCVASTSVAALYHLLGWTAPYPAASLPVLLGTLGGVGLLIGPAGLLVMRVRRDRALGDATHNELDVSFAALLFSSSLTGLLLLVLRNGSAMPFLLIVHLGFVLALLLTLPYGKFVHGLYRTAALIKFAMEEGGAPAAMPSRGHGNPRRGISVSSRWGWGPSASE